MNRIQNPTMHFSKILLCNVNAQRFDVREEILIS